MNITDKQTLSLIFNNNTSPKNKAINKKMTVVGAISLVAAPLFANYLITNTPLHSNGGFIQDSRWQVFPQANLSQPLFVPDPFLEYQNELATSCAHPHPRLPTVDLLDTSPAPPTNQTLPDWLLWTPEVQVLNDTQATQVPAENSTGITTLAESPTKTKIMMDVASKLTRKGVQMLGEVTELIMDATVGTCYFLRDAHTFIFHNPVADFIADKQNKPYIGTAIGYIYYRQFHHNAQPRQ